MADASAYGSTARSFLQLNETTTSELQSSIAFLFVGILIGFFAAPPLELFLACKLWAWSRSSWLSKWSRHPEAGLPKKQHLFVCLEGDEGLGLEAPESGCSVKVNVVAWRQRICQLWKKGLFRWSNVASIVCRSRPIFGEKDESAKAAASVSVHPPRDIVWCDRGRPCDFEIRRKRSRSAPPSGKSGNAWGRDIAPCMEFQSASSDSHDLKRPHSNVGRSSSYESLPLTPSVITQAANHVCQSKHLRTRSVPRSGSYGDSPILALQRLVPQRQSSLHSAGFSSPRAVVEGFFMIGHGADDQVETRQCWPESLKGSQLEQVVVKDGFCPNPARFWRTGSDGFDGQQFVFTLLETTLDDHADPNGVLFGCVCRATSSCKYDAYDDQSESGEVLCVISRFPIFSFHFALLNALRSRIDGAKELLARVHAMGFNEALVTHGISLEGFPCGMRRLKLRLPQAQDCALGNVLSICSTSHIFARFQASWGLELLLDQWSNLLGDTLARLVACVLLEQKILLLGDPACISAMSLVLRALLWPFRWLHPFLSAPPPSTFLRMPLLDATFPIMVGLTELPVEWGCKTQYDLPSDVVVGMLSHDYVYASPSHVTSGGLKSGDIKLPTGRHTTFLKQAAQAKLKLKKQELSLQSAVEAVHDSMQLEVGRFASVLKDYAVAQVAIVSTNADIGVSNVAGNANSERDTSRILRDTCFKRATHTDSFLNWLASEKPDELHGATATSFYSTFFRTQLCLDYLYREITSLTHQRGLLVGK